MTIASTYDATQRRHTDLITADKVNGTEVYNNNDEKLGSIDSILIDKQSGKVAYVVMSFGGFLGIGEKFHPLPWDVLHYDTSISGYRVDLDRKTLTAAPQFSREGADSFDASRDAVDVDSYYAPMTGTAYVPHAGLAPDRPVAASGEPGFYSPEQQASRNGGANAATTDREAVGGVPGTATGDWPDSRGTR